MVSKSVLRGRAEHVMAVYALWMESTFRDPDYRIGVTGSIGGALDDSEHGLVSTSEAAAEMR